MSASDMIFYDTSATMLWCIFLTVNLTGFWIHLGVTWMLCLWKCFQKCLTKDSKKLSMNVCSTVPLYEVPDWTKRRKLSCTWIFVFLLPSYGCNVTSWYLLFLQQLEQLSPPQWPNHDRLISQILRENNP